MLFLFVCAGKFYVCYSLESMQLVSVIIVFYCFALFRIGSFVFLQEMNYIRYVKTCNYRDNKHRNN